MDMEVIIQTAIAELQRFFTILNKHYFNDELERPIITIQTDTTAGAYGWITVSKVWNRGEEEQYREINLCAEYLNRNPEEVIATLLHEMCHLYNLQNDIQDTSRSGTYHNAKFKKTAETRGLYVQKCEKYGHCITSPTFGMLQLLDEHNLNNDCFKLNRLKVNRNGKKPTGESRKSSRKYVCPSCSLIVRAYKDITGKLLCIDCKEIFIES